jgi:hypothetical protein
MFRSKLNNLSSNVIESGGRNWRREVGQVLNVTNNGKLLMKNELVDIVMPSGAAMYNGKDLSRKQSTY